MMDEGKTLDQIREDVQVSAEFAEYGLPDRLQTTLALYYYELLGVPK